MPALALCRKHRATLIIAKLDRLARNVHFISGLMESGVDFVACDMPQASRLTIHILAAVAEHEREMISKRTKEALAARKARGHALGTPRPVAFLKEMAAKKRTANQPHRDAALPLLLGLKAQKLTYRAIAEEMNRRGMKPTGHARQWYASTVQYHLKTHAQALASGPRRINAVRRPNPLINAR